ncbi:MAG TPA: CDP-alcohol phosphatidyltransferase family protein [Thermoanaerobaculia bacterium]|nr:CDP-alcohol phosphatidyltransferase family protein [Thermoanaerobaculia bacterium]
MHVWRERLARWFDAPARRSPLSPNAITLVALLLNLGAAAALLGGSRRPALFLVGVALLAAGGLADAFDGIVARVQGRTSRFGDFLDHVADRISDTAVAAGWMIGSGVSHLLTVVGIIVVMLNGYIGTQIEATWRERSYDVVGRGEFVLALIVYPLVSYTLARNGWMALPFGGLTIPEWMTLLLVAAGVFGIGQRLALAARLERGH